MSAVPATDLILGRYRPLKPLGTGGSGSVWLARDEQTGLDVSLKIVAREGKAGARAEREAKAATKLRHERCLRAYALARDPSHVYIAYEYVPGRTLREALRAGDVDDAGAVEIAAQILDGLAHAHARGIVHRDVKPSNILLAEGPGHSVRILDFGLALMGGEETLTAKGDVPGTLAYISPERLKGETAGPAADVWAVGVLLWEALAGWHPFWSGSLVDTSRKIQAGAPPLERARPDLPTALHDAVASALWSQPGRRPPAVQLAETLRDATRRRRKKAKNAPPPRRRATNLVARLAPAGLAGVASGWSATALPFYPAGWPIGIAAAAAALTFARERIGLAFALAVPFFPLANLSLGLALLYAVLAAGWIALSWRDPRSGLFLAVGPLLAPVAALGLLPLAAQLVRGHGRRAAQVGAAVLLTGVVAGLRHVGLPFTGDRPPLGIGVAGSDRPSAVAGELWAALSAHPALGVEAAALAVAAALLPFVRRRGPWPAALFAGAFLCITLLAVPGVAPAPLVAAAWITWAALTFEPAH